MPTLFAGVVYYYKKRGKLGDPDVKRAIGFMYRPFHDGKEWWMFAEMSR